jgi:hypothetical protein
LWWNVFLEKFFIFFDLSFWPNLIVLEHFPQIRKICRVFCMAISIQLLLFYTYELLNFLINLKRWANFFSIRQRNRARLLICLNVIILILVFLIFLFQMISSLKRVLFLFMIGIFFHWMAVRGN